MFKSFWKVFRFRDEKADKAAADKADRDWALEVKRRARYICEVCGRKGLDAAHIISRRYKATRHVVENGCCLCRQCHQEHHGHVLKLYGRAANGKLRWERVG